MASSVICISALDGVGVQDIVPRVADRLGFNVVDAQILARAARDAGVDVRKVAEAEQRRPLLERIVGELGPDGAMLGGVMVPSPERGLSDDDLRALIRDQIEAVGHRGRAVIFAHAASFALGDREGVLRVLLTASPHARRRNLAAEQDLDARACEKQLARGDANRADYLKRFYGVKSESPADYDIVLNTDRLAPERVVELIVQGAQD